MTFASSGNSVIMYTHPVASPPSASAKCYLQRGIRYEKLLAGKILLLGVIQGIIKLVLGMICLSVPAKNRETERFF